MIRTTLGVGVLTLAICQIVGQAHATYVDEVLADNPVGYWRLEEGTGTAADTANAAGAQGGAQDGTYSGDAPQIAGAISTEGSNSAVTINTNGGPLDVIAIPDNPAGVIGSTQSFTYEAWVNPVDLGGGPRIILGRGFHAIGGVDFLGQFSPNFRFGPNSGGGGTIDVPGVVPGEWAHLVSTMELLEPGKTQLNVYVNGSLTAAVAFAASCDLTGLCGEPSDKSGINLTIGGLHFEVEAGPPSPGPNDYIQFFQGGVDEVAFYDYVLSPERIAAHFRAGVPEPSTVILLAACCLGMCGLGRWRAVW